MHNPSDIKRWHNGGYVFTKVKEDNLEEVKRLNEFKSALLVAIEQNSKLRHLTNDKNYQSILHYMNDKNRAKVKDIDEQLKKYL
jgi:HKD family nuclease